MIYPSKKITVGTRESPLAKAQVEFVFKLLIPEFIIKGNIKQKKWSSKFQKSQK